MLAKMGKRGFTLIELVMVIVILAILAIVAIPQFFDLSNDAGDAAMDGVVGGVRAGIATVHANNLANGTTPAYPATLDSAANGACSTTEVCFDTVLGQGAVTSGDWTRNSDTSYTFTGGTTDTTFTYTPATGAFQ
jgi:prepilin-type N-terminal cleavage/methylation domain-containing protein